MLRTALIALAATVAFATAFAPATASFGFCNEPQPPWCINNLSASDPEFQFTSCRNDVEEYVRETDHFVDCLRDQQNYAIKKSNKTVELFNCKARGGTACF